MCCVYFVTLQRKDTFLDEVALNKVAMFPPVANILSGVQLILSIFSSIISVIHIIQRSQIILVSIDYSYVVIEDSNSTCSY